MSRIARKPIKIPAGVSVSQNGDELIIKGPKGQFEHQLHAAVEAKLENDTVLIVLRPGAANKAMLGTTCVLIINCITGVHTGFERKLKLVGVGYRAKAAGKKLELSLGFSHPVNYPVPEGITIETPSNTEIVIKGADKQQVGQIAAEIRALRPPEIYKGKGVRYEDERLILKETKKK